MSEGITKECPRPRSHILPQRVVSSQLSRASLVKELRIFYSYLNLTLAKGSCHSVVEYLIVVEGAPSRLHAGDGVEAGGRFPATITVEYPSDWFHRIVCAFLIKLHITAIHSMGDNVCVFVHLLSCI